MSSHAEAHPVAKAFTFVTANDPKQFKTPSTMKSVRQNAMLNYLEDEARNPNSTDIRITRRSSTRKRKRESNSDEPSPPERRDSTMPTPNPQWFYDFDKATPSASSVSSVAVSYFGTDASRDSQPRSYQTSESGRSDQGFRQPGIPTSGPTADLSTAVIQRRPKNTNSGPYLQCQWFSRTGVPSFINPKINVQALKRHCK